MKHGQNSYPVLGSFMRSLGFFDGKNLDFWRIGSKPFLWRILKTGEKATRICSAHHSLHVALCTSPSARHSLHVTPCTSLPARRSLYAAPCTSLSARRSLHTLCTSLSARQSLHTHTHTLHDLYWVDLYTLCMLLPARHSLHVTLCIRTRT